jgi:LEA14-like dessication related protein
MKHPCLRLLLASALLALIAACATTRSADTFEVSLADVRFTEATALETTGVFVIRVQNQSPEALQCNGAVHKVTLNGIRVGSGVNKETLALDRLSDGTQTVTVRFGNIALARLLHDLSQTKRVSWQLDSTLYLQAGTRSWTAKTSRTGALDLKEFQTPRPAGN